MVFVTSMNIGMKEVCGLSTILQNVGMMVEIASLLINTSMPLIQDARYKILTRLVMVPVNRGLLSMIQRSVGMTVETVPVVLSFLLHSPRFYHLFSYLFSASGSSDEQ